MQPDRDRPINLELFPCSGGMAKGFQSAGIEFDVAIEWMRDHCDSYEHNIGHRPLCMDVRDFRELVQVGHWNRRVGLLVADPPCTPWSRAGKRMGTEDPRDMLAETCELIALLQPDVYLIGNVPGLDDGPNLPIVQRLIGGLARYGYCTADFARLDAANYGVPQHRVRPFWFGHKTGPCIRWPAPSHGDPADLRDQLTIPGVEALIPWVTCRQALGHLSLEELGRPVKLRRRSCNSSQHGTVADKPARTVGTSNLSDGNVILPDDSMPSFTIQDARGGVEGLNVLDEPSHAIVKNTHGNGSILVLNDKHPPNDPDKPSATLGAKDYGTGPNVLVMTPNHPPSQIDEPAMTVRGTSGGGAIKTLQLDGESPRKGGPRKRDRSLPNAVVISEKAAAILQGFPEGWLFKGDTKDARFSQLGQAMPPPLAGAVARSVAQQIKASDVGVVPIESKQSLRKKRNK